MAWNNNSRLLKPQISTAKILSMVNYGDSSQSNGVHYSVALITIAPYAYNISYIHVQPNVKKKIYTYIYIPTSTIVYLSLFTCKALVFWGNF